MRDCLSSAGVLRLCVPVLLATVFLFQATARSDEDCVSCHEDWYRSRGEAPVVHPDFRAGDCGDCHLPHGAANNLVLRDASNELCLYCHERTEEDLEAATIHPPVRRGPCWKCHDPHASAFPDLLREPGKDLCFGCHTDLARRMKAQNLHWPAREGCDRCHVAHGSDYPYLLRGRPTDLCDGCHGTSAAAMGEIHKGIVPPATSCLRCHNPHSSASDWLLLKSVHEPVRAGNCPACHTGGPAVASNELCGQCHSETNTTENTHQPVRDGACADCHRDHTSPFRALLRRPELKTCLDCHTGIGEQLRKSHQHPPFRDGDCGACHDPHGATPDLLKGPAPSALCHRCHTFPEKSPVEYEHSPDDLGKCLDCHNPHSSDSEGLLRSPEAGE